MLRSVRWAGYVLRAVFVALKTAYGVLRVGQPAPPVRGAVLARGQGS